MDNSRFVMITNWDKHWDKLPKQRTSFTKRMIYGESILKIIDLNGSVETLFIKLSDEGNFERSWTGNVSNFSVEEDKIWFTVSDLKPYDKPNKFNTFRIGWHLVKDLNFETLVDELIPTFFSRMASTSNAEEFENYCFYLLKLLGIHDVYPIRDQSGRSDGFFQYAELSVLYDATLRYPFEKHKKDQIENYVEQLSKNVIEIGNKAYTTKGRIKSVWIITKGNSVRNIKTIDGIKVLEIPYTYLIRLYNTRLAENLDDNDFKRWLLDPELIEANIGR